jgi:hypothetical protein
MHKTWYKLIMAMEELIGKTITKLFMYSGAYLVFECSDGEILAYRAEGDCCSSSWFEHVTLCGLLNNVVIETNYAGGSRTDDNEYDTLEISNYEVKTAKGISTFELRNSSNGYYSGYIKKCDYHLLSSEIKYKRKEVTEDI